METKGIRILDKKDGVLNVTLIDILEEIHDGNLFHWSILFLDGMPKTGLGKALFEYGNQINESENGLSINWKDLLLLSDKFFQIYQTIILGSKDRKLLHRYKDEQEMYETCDRTIEQIDCAFWEVFSKDEELINRLAAKFKDIEFLAPDFVK